ncbi:hypothetical protein F4808DRAFT_390227 [Astrocystis sublimbata]|nr:hypothetical protein F4808DRAFT_390227 [Astrocystis sublimbata]
MSLDIKSNSVKNGEEPVPAPATKGHFKRFWWAYLLAFLVVATVVVVPSVLLVAVPKIAQDKLNDAKLKIDGIAVTNTKPDSFLMKINSTIEADSSVSAVVAAFTGTMYLADVDPPLAITQIEFPETTSSSAQSVNISQEVQISDSGAFAAFNKALLSKDSVEVQVKGDTHIRVSGISKQYPVTFDKKFTLKGLNNFDGLLISNTSINPLAKTDNFKATAHIPNPTVLTLDIGNATFTNYFNGEVVGQTHINNLVLYPGNNTFPTTSDIKQLPILKALTTKPYCELDGKLPFQLQGKNVTNNGEVIPYFRDALAANNQSITVDISDAAKKLGIPTKCVGILA